MKVEGDQSTKQHSWVRSPIMPINAVKGSIVYSFPMVTIVPSQIVEYIDTSVSKNWTNQMREVHLGADEAVPIMLGLLGLVERVPAHLITLRAEDAAQLLANLELIRAGVQKAQTTSFQERLGPGIPPLKPVRPGGASPVEVVRTCLAKCSDDAPHPKTPDLSFLNDDELRASLRSDLDQSHRALENDHWKSSIVMAGVVLESLLLWKLLTEPSAKAVTKRKWEPESWHLPDYIAVATAANLITEEIRKQCELCKDFRNLIHPGREIRLQQKATRGRALGSLAAVEMVIEHFS